MSSGNGHAVVLVLPQSRTDLDNLFHHGNYWLFRQFPGDFTSFGAAGFAAGFRTAVSPLVLAASFRGWFLCLGLFGLQLFAAGFCRPAFFLATGF